LSLSLFQWIGLGLAIALILIPIVRWFWLLFDKPSKRALEILKQQEDDVEEARVWAGIEAQVEIETTLKREMEMKRKEKQERSGKSLDEETSADLWTKLGVDVPIKPVEREEAPPIKLENKSAIVTDSPSEPDWELVEKMSKLDAPLEGVPEAPDLDQLSGGISEYE
tara:strand:+ start:11599 stop:12099 length:501 start_codon:yes stop_codon:yes gene_type:complete